MIESFDTVSNTILVRKSHESWINCVGIMAARGARARIFCWLAGWAAHSLRQFGANGSATLLEQWSSGAFYR